MVDVLLLRHAQSAWNAEGRWQGQADPSLSEYGLDHVRTATLDLPSISFVAASDLERARQTAAVLAERIGVSSVEVRRGLRERNVGAWSGLTNLEIDQRWPDQRGSGRTPEDWEDDGAVIKRVTEDLVLIATMGTPGPVLVVTHGGVLGLLEKHLGVVDRQPFRNLEGRWISVAATGAMALGGRVALGR